MPYATIRAFVDQEHHLERLGGDLLHQIVDSVASLRKCLNLRAYPLPNGESRGWGLHYHAFPKLRKTLMSGAARSSVGMCKRE
jgi:hypothetical protein